MKTGKIIFGYCLCLYLFWGIANVCFADFIAPGKIVDNQYIYSQLGLTINIPAGWQVLSQQKLEEAVQKEISSS
ncbi:MAG: hypothetical protein K0S08_441 [Gammaproteobacteria bacterium]|jgi:predicted Zn-dependent protease|nr:hypothetical protein [Gammaproteobacteria bacterium]